MKSIYSIIILLMVISCSKPDLIEDQLTSLELSTHFPDIPETLPTPNNLTQSSTIRYKAKFNYYTCRLQSSSHHDIYAYMSNSKLILRSKTKCLTKATHLYYTDIDDYEAIIRYPKYGTYTLGGYSYLVLSISRILSCVDRVEMTLFLDDECGLNVPQMKDS